MTRSYEDYLADILYAIEKAQEFVEGVDADDFYGNTEKIFAVIRALEIIGEAARHIPSDIQRQHPDIPWAEIIGMRNVVIHDYFGVDNEVIWRTVQEDLPPLQLQLADFLQTISIHDPSAPGRGPTV